MMHEAFQPRLGISANLRNLLDIGEYEVGWWGFKMSLLIRKVNSRQSHRREIRDFLACLAAAHMLALPRPSN